VSLVGSEDLSIIDVISDATQGLFSSALHAKIAKKAEPPPPPPPHPKGGGRGGGGGGGGGGGPRPRPRSGSARLVSDRRDNWVLVCAGIADIATLVAETCYPLS